MDLKTIIVAVALLSPLSLLASDQTKEAQQACNKATELATTDVKAAHEEATWCAEILSQMLQQLTANLLPDAVLDYQGDEIQQQKMMGFSMTSRQYSNGSEIIKVSMNEGKAAGMMAQYSAYGGAKKVRVQGVPGAVNSDQRKSTASFALKNERSLTIEGKNKDEVMKFINAFPIKKINEAG